MPFYDFQLSLYRLAADDTNTYNTYALLESDFTADMYTYIHYSMCVGNVRN